MNKELVDALKDNVEVKTDKLKEDEIDVTHLSYLQLRDIIWKLGRVVLEQEEQNIYIAAIKAGSAGGNTAYLALKLNKDKLYIVGYAKEGLLNQRTYEKALVRLRKAIEDKENAAGTKQ
jgi:hypothetical protein